MTAKLNGRVAIVTGASSGIGAAIAREFGAEGAAVVAIYNTNRSGAETVVADIIRSGGRGIAAQGDVTQEASANAIVDAAIEAFGKLDILVNNAGISQFRPIEEFSLNHFASQISTNVLGPLLVTSAAVKHLQIGASIINIGSSATSFAPAGSAVYTATKAAVDGFTSVLANELGPRGIRVNALKPGITPSEDSFDDNTPEGRYIKMFADRTPLRRLGRPIEIAKAAVFLASDDANFVTGEHLMVSGGLR